jgi:membrane associated rhomboid family serine protease
MVQAPVGWHCQQCVKRDARQSPVVRYRPGSPNLPTLRETPVTMALIAVCVVLYIASSANPNLLNDAAEAGVLVQGGQWYRLFTAIFFHLDFLHIALNMVSLLVIGRLVEPVLGKWRYLALFLVTGLGGAVASYLFANPLQEAVGASGAIFGLFGAYFVLARRASANTSGIVVLIAVNLVFSFTVPGIAWQDHVGGLVTGLVVATGLGLARHGRHRQEVIADAAVLVATCTCLGLLLLLPPGVVNLG